MKLYVVCYLERDDKYLMLYRNKKENDINEGKWIGVGGRIEENETPFEANKREVFEETGYTIENARLRGFITFVYNKKTDYMFVFSSKDFSGDLIDECPEGELKFIPKNEIENLNLWEGDIIFLKHLLNDDKEIFSYRMEYENDKLIMVTDEIKR